MASAKWTPRFWKPGSEGPGRHLNEERIASSDDAGATVIHNSHGSMSIDQQRQRLPVFSNRNNILYLVEKYQTVVIVGETGCGKSTQIPQYLLEAGWAAGRRVIGVTQPRRVAAVTVATRVAEERASILGHEVGYAIRFDDCTSPSATRVKFVTDGLLIREMMADPLLSQYSVIMLDEAHERSLNTDIVVGLLKKIQRKRKDLRIIVASATLDAEKFRDFFNHNSTNDPSKDTCTILSVEGRMYPVDIFYALDPVPDYLKATVQTVMSIHRQEATGDVLAFLTGQEEVHAVVSLLIEEARRLAKDAMKMWVLPMYGSLPAADQMKVFQRTGRNTRKMIIATNIAEASITISGIVYVVDCGFVKIKAFNPDSGLEALLIVPTSQASAQQRAGRAGRARSGKAFRLYTEDQFHKLPENAVPEMQRSGMATVVLQLKALGIDNVVKFQFPSPPPAQSMVHGVELLYALGALDRSCQLTQPLGQQMAEFPLHPMFAKLLLVSEEFGCSEEALTVVAMMQIQNVFLNPAKERHSANRAHRLFAVAEGDHVTMLNVFSAFLQKKGSSQWCQKHYLNYKGLKRAVEIRAQLLRLLHDKFKVKLVSCDGDVDAVRKCLTAGFFANAARLHYTGEYRTIRDDHVLHIHPTSVLYVETPPECVLFNEVVHTSKEYMRDITVIKPEWLYELAPHYYQYGTERQLAAKRQRWN